MPLAAFMPTTPTAASPRATPTFVSPRVAPARQLQSRLSLWPRVDGKRAWGARQSMRRCKRACSSALGAILLPLLIIWLVHTCLTSFLSIPLRCGHGDDPRETRQSIGLLTRGSAANKAGPSAPLPLLPCPWRLSCLPRQQLLRPEQPPPLFLQGLHLLRRLQSRRTRWGPRLQEEENNDGGHVSLILRKASHQPSRQSPERLLSSTHSCSRGGGGDYT
ncbi:hypothetical protein ACSQ67_006178 [Phaseolus vulgaris]